MKAREEINGGHRPIFIGRQDERAIFEDILSQKRPQRVLLHIYNEGTDVGGMGKTLLLEEFRSFTLAHKIKTTNDIIDFYESVNLTELGLIENIARQFEHEAFERFFDLMDHIKIERRGQLEEIQTVFTNCLNDISAKGRIVLMFDTLEKISSGFEQRDFREWFLESLLPGFKNIIVIIAGRGGWNLGDMPGWKLITKKLSYFTDKDIREYFKHFNMDLAKTEIDRLRELSEGRPISIAFAADLVKNKICYVHDLIDSKIVSNRQFRDLLIEKFTKSILGLSQEDIVTGLMAHVHHRFDKEMLKYLMRISDSEAEHFLNKMREYFFIKYKPYSKSIFLHDEVREDINTFIWDTQDPSGEFRKAISKDVIHYYDQCIATNKKEREKPILRVEKLYHELYLDLDDGFSGFKKLFKEVSNSYYQNLLMQITSAYKDQFDDHLRYEYEFRRGTLAYNEGRYGAARNIFTEVESRLREESVSGEEEDKIESTKKEVETWLRKCVKQLAKSLKQEIPVSVFISANPKSRIMPEVEKAIESIPIEQEWLINWTPNNVSAKAYGKVHERTIVDSDIFVALPEEGAAEKLVKKEYEIARRNKKPCLVFLLKSPERREIQRSLGAKNSNPVDFKVYTDLYASLKRLGERLIKKFSQYRAKKGKDRPKKEVYSADISVIIFKNHHDLDEKVQMSVLETLKRGEEKGNIEGVRPTINEIQATKTRLFGYSRMNKSRVKSNVWTVSALLGILLFLGQILSYSAMHLKVYEKNRQARLSSYRGWPGWTLFPWRIEKHGGEDQNEPKKAVIDLPFHVDLLQNGEYDLAQRGKYAALAKRGLRIKCFEEGRVLLKEFFSSSSKWWIEIEKESVSDSANSVKFAEGLVGLQWKVAIDELLEHKTFEIRRAGYKALGNVGDSLAAAVLSERWSDADPGDQPLIILEMGKIGEPDFVAIIHSVLLNVSAYPWQRELAYNALVAYRKLLVRNEVDNDVALTPLLKFLESSRRHYEEVQRMAVKAIAEVDNPEALDLLLTLLNNGVGQTYGYRIIAAAIDGLIRNGVEAKAADRIIQSLNIHKGASKRIPPARALVELDNKLDDASMKKISRTLIALLPQTYEGGRYDIALALGELGDSSATAPLVSALQDRNWNWNYGAAIALGNLGDTKSVPALINVLKRTDVQKNVVLRTVEALGNFGDKRAVEPIIDLSKQIYLFGEPETFRTALTTLTGENFGLDFDKWQSWWSYLNISEEEFDSIEEQIGSEYDNERLRAVERLVRLGLALVEFYETDQYERVLFSLENVKAHDDSQIKKRTGEGLQRIASKHFEIAALHIDDRRYLDAVRHYQQAVKLDSGLYAQSKKAMGGIYHDSLFEFEKSLQVHKNLLSYLEEYPDSSMSLSEEMNLTENYFTVGQYDSTITVSMGILDRDIGSINTIVMRFLLVASYSLKGQNASATKNLAIFVDDYKQLSTETDSLNWNFAGTKHYLTHQSQIDDETKEFLLEMIHLLDGRILRSKLDMFLKKTIVNELRFSKK